MASWCFCGGKGRFGWRRSPFLVGKDRGRQVRETSTSQGLLEATPNIEGARKALPLEPGHPNTLDLDFWPPELSEK